MLIFLKLGGSLITDKSRPYRLRNENLARASEQIARARKEDPSLRILLGHGSGSFGHQAASGHGTRAGVSTPAQWQGFSEVWYRASELNRHVIDALRAAGLPAVTISPFAAVLAQQGRVKTWDIGPIVNSLEHELLPVIHGDVLFDSQLGGTILSTEELFVHLARLLRPERILLAGLEPGIWADFPARRQLLQEIHSADAGELGVHLTDSGSVDVTGGMREKVKLMLPLCELSPAPEILILSGEKTDNIHSALMGQNPGTRLSR
jgi:isopentenyl phosphate kinase